MCSGREHHELRRWQTRHVTVRFAAAKQAKELHRVRQAQAVWSPTRMGVLSATTSSAQS
ncbi:MAG TPA: hypothetical protein VHZ51_16190 [Ktedonobacteraceae bacterium]|nr:hypothetical protein [Ktedonobacteraceae bacterium]